MKHTPGPWKVTDEDIFGNGMIAIETDLQDYPCHVENWLDNPEEAHANARLIAAAPDLLKVLKKWNTFMENNYNDNDVSWWAETKQAIHKAEG